jgi:hypothetical protein
MRSVIGASAQTVSLKTPTVRPMTGASSAKGAVIFCVSPSFDQAELAQVEPISPTGPVAATA